MIVDTDVLIWYFRGDKGARRFLGALAFPERTISALTVMELIQGCRDGREAREIAATALEVGAALGTGNVRHDRAIAGLSVVNFRPRSV